MVKRLLITGTRLGWDENELKRALRAAYEELSKDDLTVILVHGAARGVDRQAAEIWKGWYGPTEAHPADWKRYRNAAGPRRNTKMIKLGADLCLAFIHPESRGTLDCVRKVEKAGIPVQKFYTTDNARKTSRE